MKLTRMPIFTSLWNASIDISDAWPMKACIAIYTLTDTSRAAHEGIGAKIYLHVGYVLVCSRIVVSFTLTVSSLVYVDNSRGPFTDLAAKSFDHSLPPGGHI